MSWQTTSRASAASASASASAFAADAADACAGGEGAQWEGAACEASRAAPTHLTTRGGTHLQLIRVIILTCN